MRSFSWIYPGEDLVPIQERDGYRDYYLRDILKNRGCSIAMLRPRSMDGDIRIFYEDDVLTNCYVADIYPIAKLSLDVVSGLFGFGVLDRYDLVVRYCLDSEKPLIPRWVSIVDPETKVSIYSV